MCSSPCKGRDWELGSPARGWRGTGTRSGPVGFVPAARLLSPPRGLFFPGCFRSGASTVPGGPATHPGPRLPAAGGAGAARPARPAQAGTQRWWDRPQRGAHTAGSAGTVCSRAPRVPLLLACKCSYTLKTSLVQHSHPRVLCERAGEAAGLASLTRRQLGPCCRGVCARGCARIPGLSSWHVSPWLGSYVRCAWLSQAASLPEPAPFHLRGRSGAASAPAALCGCF